MLGTVDVVVNQQSRVTVVLTGVARQDFAAWRDACALRAVNGEVTETSTSRQDQILFTVKSTN
jgi:hypothetical protein